MLLSEVFDRLANNELMGLDLVTDQSELDTQKYPRVMAGVNAALNQLYVRFPIKLKEVVVQQYDHIFDYTLHPDFAQSNDESAETYKYIIDYAADPFIGDVAKIEQVFDEAGEELVLNDESEHYSLFTPSYNVLQIPYPDSENAVGVIYRANAPRLDRDPSDPTAIEVPIGWQYFEPLIAYTCHVLFNGPNIGGHEDNSRYFAKYEGLCQEIEKRGVFNVERNQNLKLWRNGWV